MNGTATVTASEDHQHQHQQAQNETTSDHPRSPASPLSIRHGELIPRKFKNAEKNNSNRTYRHIYIKPQCIRPFLETLNIFLRFVWYANL